VELNTICVAHDYREVYRKVHVKHVTCSALAQMVTGSNFDMAIAVLANVIRAGPAFSRQLSGRS
jgi:hypothetical protein